MGARISRGLLILGKVIYYGIEPIPNVNCLDWSRRGGGIISFKIFQDIFIIMQKVRREQERTEHIRWEN